MLAIFENLVVYTMLEFLSEEKRWYISKMICYRQPSYDQGWTSANVCLKETMNTVFPLCLK